MIKTAIENNQNLIVEGCYVPFDYEKYFTAEYLKHIKYYCLIMSENYIKNHLSDIENNSCVIENRLFDTCDFEEILADNKNNLELARSFKVNYVLIENDYLEEIKNFLEV